MLSSCKIKVPGADIIIIGTTYVPVGLCTLRSPYLVKAPYEQDTVTQGKRNNKCAWIMARVSPLSPRPVRITKSCTSTGFKDNQSLNLRVGRNRDSHVGIALEPLPRHCTEQGWSGGSRPPS